MRALLSILALLAVGFAIADEDVEDRVKLTTRGRVVCYYNARAVFRPSLGSYPVSEIPAGLCTHVVYGYVGISQSHSEIEILDYNNEIARTQIKNFSSLRKQYPGVKFVVNIGSSNKYDAAFARIISNPAARANFTRSVLNLLNDYGFDGLNWAYNWGYQGPGKDITDDHKNNFLTVLQELRNLKKNMDLTISVPLFQKDGAKGFNIPAISNLVDAFYVNSYNLRGPSNGFVDVPCPLHGRPDDPPSFTTLNLDNSLKLLESMGFPPHKLVMGVPTYGHSYSVSPINNTYDVGTKSEGKGTAGIYTNKEGLLAYYELSCLILGNSTTWTQKWSKHGASPYIYKQTVWIGFENVRSMAAKIHWITTRGYNGIMLWSIDLDDFGGICGPKNPLLNAVSNFMKNYSVPLAIDQP